MNEKNANITVYTADTADLDNDALFEKLYAVVSEERKRKTDKCRFRKNKNQSLCAEYLLMCACREYGAAYAAQRVETNNGKPAFAASSLRFNLSHSEKRAMCVMADCEIGCDVEKVECCNRELARRFFAAEEVKALDACPTEEARDILFYRIWTLKESYLKCTGTGIRIPLDSFSVVENGGIRRSLYADGAEYLLFEEEIEASYRYALCIRGKADMDGAAYERIREGIRVEKCTISL